MAKKAYDEVSVVRILSRKKGCEITGKTIHVDPNATDLGNGSWGKIDFLENHRGYVVVNQKKGAKRESKTLTVEDKLAINKQAFDKIKQGSHPSKLSKVSITMNVLKTHSN